MRPRVFPADDRDGRHAIAVLHVTSMRPRVFPADDPRGLASAACPASDFNEAAGIPRGRHRRPRPAAAPARHTSMRPRVFPADDVRMNRPTVGRIVTSMRPRVFPADDAPGEVGAVRRLATSMRPRVFPADDRRRRRLVARAWLHFNEGRGYSPRTTLVGYCRVHRCPDELQ